MPRPTSGGLSLPKLSRNCTQTLDLSFHSFSTVQSVFSDLFSFTFFFRKRTGKHQKKPQNRFPDSGRLSSVPGVRLSAQCAIRLASVCHWYSEKMDAILQLKGSIITNLPLPLLQLILPQQQLLQLLVPCAVLWNLELNINCEAKLQLACHRICTQGAK